MAKLANSFSVAAKAAALRRRRSRKRHTAVVIAGQAYKKKVVHMNAAEGSTAMNNAVHVVYIEEWYSRRYVPVLFNISMSTMAYHGVTVGQQMP